MSNQSHYRKAKYKKAAEGFLISVVPNPFPAVAHRSGFGQLDRLLEKIFWIVTKHFSSYS